MKSNLRHITVFCLTAMMLVASVGISVCCLFGCHSSNGEVSELSSCCEVADVDQCQEQSKQGCPDCSDEYVNLDVEYLTPSFDFKISIPVTDFVPRSFSFSEINTSQKAIQLWELNLPPPPFGKELLPHIQSFRC